MHVAPSACVCSEVGRMCGIMSPPAAVIGKHDYHLVFTQHIISTNKVKV